MSTWIVLSLATLLDLLPPLLQVVRVLMEILGKPKASVAGVTPLHLACDNSMADEETIERSE